MEIRYTSEQEELRSELRTYFAGLMTAERREAFTSTTGEYGHGSAYRDIVAQMGQDGWLTLGWPEEYGGRARPMIDQLIFTDEAAIAGVPVPFLTINSVAPTIMAFGSAEQKEYFLPRISRGELHFAIGYSEPDSGTDLASLRTRAVKETGDEGTEVYRINGQKMWTSLVAYADWIWLAARTDPEAARHKGISMLTVPTTAEGFSWTPVRTMAGPDTSATYYQDVIVPASNLVGPEHGGWPLMTNQLNHERVALTAAGPLQASLRQVLEWARETPSHDVGLGGHAQVIDHEWVRTHLARVHAMAEYLALRNWEIVSEGSGSGGSPGRIAASATKVYGTETACEAYRLLMEVLGACGYQRGPSPIAALHGRIERLHRSALILTFGGGTNEVQRDIIATAGLGLPAAPRVAASRKGN